MKPVFETPPRTVMEVYKNLPQDTRAELIENQLYMSPSPAFAHQKTIQGIFRRLCSEVLDTGRGEVILAPFDVYLDEVQNVVQPDIIVVLNQNLTIIDRTGHIHGVPDILVEVLSPNNRDRDLVLKKALYEKSGVREYWIVDPETKATSIYQWKNGRYVLVSEDVGIVKSILLDVSMAF